MRRIELIFASLFILFTQNAWSQTCSGAPSFNVNLVGQPAGVWLSPDHSRGGSCCSSNNCTSFNVVLDTGAAMINLEILSGAIPTGSLFYKINCGPPIAVGAPICVNGQYTFTITFCKPGNNPNVYKITSIAKPTLPPNPLTVRLGCINTLTTLGFVPGTVTWNSIAPGNSGDYNYLLSSTNSTAPNYTPHAGLPGIIDYRVCGTPQNSICPGASGTFCDTFRIINVGPITGTVTPTNPGFCAGGNVSITAAAGGGAPPYTYIWRDQNNNQVGTGPAYTASVAGTYQVEIRDAVYAATTCPGLLISVPVQVTQPPTANAGADVTVCASSPAVVLNGSSTSSSGVVWSGGAGTYVPNSTSSSISYTPTGGELAAGFVNLTFTANALGGGCVNASDVVKITYPPLLTNSVPSYTLACFASTTTIAPAVGGGVLPYSYSWSTGATTSSIVAGSGNYCMTVTDAMGCSAISCGTVTVPSVLTLTTSSTDVTTVAPANDGTASAVPGGGTPPYTYLWTPGGQTIATATGLVVGSYSVLVTDANGCTISSSEAINPVSCNDLLLVMSSSDVDCFGNATGTATVTATGGGGPGVYTYSWNTIPVQTTAVATGLTAGPYQVTVISPNVCSDVAGVTINQPPVLGLTMSHSDVTLVGGSNGTATATTTGGTAPYTYAWNPSVGTTSAVSGLVMGGYTVTVTDSEGCSLTDSVRILQPVCTSLVLNMAATHVSCFSGSNGTATANLLFGTMPYAYLWNVGGQTASSIAALPAGTVSVTVTDAVNCALSGTVTITQPPVLTLSLVATDVICNGGASGTLNLTVSGGTFPYTYLWTNNVTVEDQINLPVGFYGVTVTDAKGCTAMKSATINQPAALSAISAHVNVTCKSGSDGSINATISGGITPYTYLWSHGPTTEDVSGLATGQYTLSVTDANGCNSPTALNIFINEPDSVDLDSVSIACPVPGTGLSKVDMIPIGGDGGPYTISFTNGTTYLAPGDYSELLPAGVTYSVYVKDGNGCISSLQIIKVNAEPSVAAVSFPKCNPPGIGTATITVTPAGGAGNPYSISTNNGVSYDPAGDYLDTLAIGNTYQIVIKDSLGCISLPTSIVIPDSLKISSIVSSFIGGSQVSCNGAADGFINLTVSGGTTAYSYLWSNAQTTQTITGIAAGTYSVLVTDNFGCTITHTVTLNQPTALTHTMIASNVLCNGGNTGYAQIVPSGSTAPYTYQWSANAASQTTSLATGLAIGNYSVLATDINGCTSSGTVSITQPAVLTGTISSTDVLCHGDSTGTAQILMGGGVMPYAYQWSNSMTTSQISGIAFGNYMVTITDANGCILKDTVQVGQPAVLSHSLAVTNVLCFGDSTGSINLTASGGLTPYTYVWSNGATSAQITGLATGPFLVQVTDSNGCQISDSIFIQQNSLIQLGIAPQQVSCYGNGNGAADLSVIGGVTPYSYAWSNGGTAQDQAFLVPGTYIVIVTDSAQCSKTDTVTITEPDSLWASYTANLYPNGFNISLNGQSDGSIDLTVTGGSTPYQYFWSNGATTQDLNGIAAGNYIVQITDTNGCVYTVKVLIREPYALEMPTGFSPNADGFNDYFVVHGLESYPDNKLTVYNRWGNVVFTQEDYMNTWNGQGRGGDALPEATYFVVLIINGPEKIELKGYVDLRK